MQLGHLMVPVSLEIQMEAIFQQRRYLKKNVRTLLMPFLITLSVSPVMNLSRVTRVECNELLRELQAVSKPLKAIYF